MNRAERRALAKKIARGQATPVDTKQTVIGLGYCYSERLGVSGLWHQSVIGLLVAAARGGFGIRELPVEGGPFLARARNQILRKSVGYGDDYLLFSDTDIVFRPEDVRLLLEADSAIAGALYFAAATGQTPWATALVEGESGLEPITLPESPIPPRLQEFEDPKDFEAAEMMYRAQLAEPEYGPQTVAAVGMGLTLIRREVAEAMLEAHEFPFEYVGETGEDIVFCQRAAELGFETKVVPLASVGHLKQVVL